MGVSHGNRDRVEPPGPNLVKSRDPLADPITIMTAWILTGNDINFAIASGLISRPLPDTV